jgi:hypothetical protein
MATNLAYLEHRLSGGAANSNQMNSLGGIISNTRVLSQSATAPSNVTGVVIDDAGGNATGVGTLSYTHSTVSLSWQAFGEGSAGTPVAVSSSGAYAIPSGSNGYLFVTVTAASLPGLDKSDSITIANQINKTFDDVSSGESFAGDTEYRCFYLKNTSLTDTMYGVKIWIVTQPVGADSLWLGLDPAGIGDGSATGVATTIIDEGTAPGGVTFSQPATQGGGLAIGDLGPGQCAAYWQRRDVPSETTIKTLNDYSVIGMSVFL